MALPISDGHDKRLDELAVEGSPNHLAWVVGAFAMLTHRLFRTILHAGDLTVVDAQGRSQRYGGGALPDFRPVTIRLHDPALSQLALIVRGADTGHLELAPQAPGLVAVSLGL